MSGFELLSWLTGEVFDLALSDALRKLMSRRAASARQILIEELSRGNARVEDIADRDEAAAMVFEYAEAAKRGAAHRNLRLMAQVMSNAFQRAPPLYADEFLRWSALLASLSREEIIVAATTHRVWLHPMARSSVGGTTMAIKFELIGSGKTFSDESDYLATVHALARTGLIVPVAGWDGGHHEPTKRLDDLARMARLDEGAQSSL